MTEKEKEMQRALGTLPTFSITIRVDLDGDSRIFALKETREMIDLLRKHFPQYVFKKNVLKNIDN